MSKQTDSQQETPHYDIFFSYSRKDSAAAMLIKSAIQSLGYSVFYDQDILEGDDNWRATIAKSIDLCSGFVFLRTRHSVDSDFCQRELICAEEKEAAENDINILPIAFRSDQNALPISDPLKLSLLPRQTTFISDSPTIAGLKNELRAALENSVGRPRGKENSLLLTDLVATAAENLNSRYKSLFENIQARRIEPDVLNDRISLSWPFILGDEQAKLCISLNNKYSKRPVCYANCKRKTSCPFFAEKDRQGYFLEAYLDFADHGKSSRVEPLLKSLFLRMNAFPFWCGNRGTKYFFRRPILEELEDCEINENNDFTAVLFLLQEAVRFFDSCFNDRMRQYFQFAYGIGSIFREKDHTASLLGEGWSLHNDPKSRVKLHFSKNDPADRPAESELGKLCSCAIRFPEAVRIKLKSFDPDGILIRIMRFEKNLKIEKRLRFDLMSDKEPWEKLEAEIRGILAVKKEKMDNVSRLPDYLHENLNQFITHDTPKSLCWDVLQDGSGCILTASCWFPGCPEIRFVVKLEYKIDSDLLIWTQTITSGFPGKAEDETEWLSGIVDFPVFQKNIEKPDEEVCRTWFDEAARHLNEVHSKVNTGIYQPLKNLEKTSICWKFKNAGTVLLSDTQSTDWNVNARIGSNEKFWPYYLAPGMRFCRQLKKEYPVMFCIRFERAGAKNATIGWVADGGFNSLSVREKDLFWHYVLSQFPPELQGRFACRKNAVFLAKKEDFARDPGEKRPAVFESVQQVQTVLEDWLRNTGAEGDCLMDRMFAVIEKAVTRFLSNDF